MDSGIIEPGGPESMGTAVPFPDSPAARVASFVAEGGRAVVVLCPSRATRTAVLDGILAALLAHVIRAGNPLASPLTLHRLMFQIGAGAADGDDEGLLARRLEERVGAAALLVLAVDDAHTLAVDALGALAQVPSAATGDHPGRLLILAGHPDLLLTLFKPGLEALHGPANALLVDLDHMDAGAEPDAEPDAEPAAMPPQPSACDAVPLPGARAEMSRQDQTPAAQVPWHWGRLARPLLAVVALGAAASVVAALTWDRLPAMPWTGVPGTSMVTARPAAPSPTPLPRPETAPAVPIAPAPLLVAPPPVARPLAAPVPNFPPPPPPPPPPQPAVPPAPALPAPEAQGASPPPRTVAALSDAELRRGFDAFLDRAGGDTASLSPADRAALFREYLDWRGKGAGRVAR